MPLRLIRAVTLRSAVVLIAAAILLATTTSAQDTTRARPPRDSVRPPDSARADSGQRRRPARGDSTRRRTTTPRRDPPPARPAPVWPVPAPEPLPGSILPGKRIVAFYGNPLSKRMGILGALPPEQMLAKLDSEVAKWQAADPATPVQPALHLIAVVAQGDAGRDGMYRARMGDSLIERVARWAESRNALLFLDLQVAKSTLQAELPRLIPYLKRPYVHLAIDPEFSMKRGGKPGEKIGSYDAADVNYASSLLADLVTSEKIPPKLLIVHRFTRPMLTNASKIKLDPRVQIVIHMDGWGPPKLKEDSYRAYVFSEPVQYTGFKLFYHNDTKKGHPLMQPADVLRLFPVPLYIQYQ